MLGLNVICCSGLRSGVSALSRKGRKRKKCSHLDKPLGLIKEINMCDRMIRLLCSIAFVVGVMLNVKARDLLNRVQCF